MVGKTDDEAREPFAQLRDHAQVEILGCCGIGGSALQDAELLVDGQDRVDRALDVLQRAAAGREEHGLAELRDVSLQRRVLQITRGELVRRHVELREKIRAFEVPGGREERDAELACITLKLAVVVGAELQRLPVLAVRRAERELVVVRLFVVGARVERAVRALLQLDRIRAPLVRGLDELLRLLELALVVVTDLRDHVARRFVVNFHAFDRELSDVRHRRSMLVAGATTLRTRARSASTSRRTRASKSTSGW